MNLLKILGESVGISENKMIELVFNVRINKYKIYIEKVKSIIDIKHLIFDNYDFLVAYQNNDIYGFISLYNIPDRINIYMVEYGKVYLEDAWILLNLLIVAKENLGYQIINDPNITDFGQMSWKGMRKIGVASKLYNFKEDKIYEYDAPNIIMPELDSNWFYLIDNRNKFTTGFIYPRECNVCTMPYYRQLNESDVES